MALKIMYKKQGDVGISYVLDNGKQISKEKAIQLIQANKIINATIVIRNGKPYIRSKTGAFKKAKSTAPMVNPIINNLSPATPLKRMNHYNFERDLYKDLLEWKNDSMQLALLLRGPRQVGKTYLLNKFGKEQFKHVTYVDLRNNESENLFLSIYNKLVKKHGYPSSDEAKRVFWFNAFRLFDPQFEDTDETLIIIDEIQESHQIFNAIRDIRRTLYARLACTGSYIGLAERSSNFWISAGDYKTLELNTLSYKEFLKAVGLYDVYEGILSFTLSELTAEQKEIYQKVKDAYADYIQIGGYPIVVTRYIESKGDINKCLHQVKVLLDNFSAESQRYFKDILDTKIWDQALKLVVQDLVTRKSSLKASSNTLEIRDTTKNKGFEIKRKDLNNVLGWLCLCNIIGQCYCYNDFGKTELTPNTRYFIKDMGVLNYITRLNKSMLTESDISGVRAETFVYLYLLTRVNPLINEDALFEEDMPYYGVHDTYEIDFLMHTLNNLSIALEVKNNKGNTKSAEFALNRGYVDLIIKVQNTFGSIQDKKVVLPLFAITKLDHVLKNFS